MFSRFEDFAGKALIGVVFSVLAVQGIAAIVLMLRHPGSFDGWEMVLTSRIINIAFLLLVLYLTITRLPPKDSAKGIEPRVTAIAGTFALMLLTVLPTGHVGPELQLFATLLVIGGMLLSIYCLYWLGRSFSVMATARELITSGPYSVVRHPLYIAEAVAAIGIVISNWSTAAVLVLFVQSALQLRRMRNEEQILRKIFPEYNDYASQVPMLIPSLSAPRREES